MHLAFGLALATWIGGGPRLSRNAPEASRGTPVMVSKDELLSQLTEGLRTPKDLQCEINEFLLGL